MGLIRIWADTRGNAPCGGCGRPMEWTQMVESGRRMPFDPPVVAVKTETDAATGRLIEVIDSTVTLSHFATCPDANRFRRSRKRIS